MLQPDGSKQVNTASILIISTPAIEEALDGKDMSMIIGGHYRKPASG